MSQADDLRAEIVRHIKVSLGKDTEHSSTYDWRIAVSLALRDRLVDPWFESTRRTYDEQRKRVYYLSMEFLIGRLLQNTAVNLRLEDDLRRAVEPLGVDYDAVLADEPDAALGNGGLGRLAACFLDSLSTLGIPAYGYGILYEHGLFRQRFHEGRQVETAEDWLRQRQVWQFERPEAAYRIGFGGYVSHSGRGPSWHPEETVIAAANDTPIIGWNARWGNTLRLWSARSTAIFDLERFNRGEYLAAAEQEELARMITRVLYPDDTTDQGKELRLKQEYFFTAASIQDIVRRHLSAYNTLSNFVDKAAIQLNDTHPAIAGPELIRLLTDEHRMSFEEAAATARDCLAYTNHTLLPEALERWPEGMFASILPRHHEIIERIDTWHADHAVKNGGEPVHIIENRTVKMGELAFICAHRVNGVSALHTEIMRDTVFARLNRHYPGRIVSETNGITPRRWLRMANPPLRTLIDEAIGEDWVADLEQLERLVPLTNDAAFLDRFMAAKHANKQRLVAWLQASHDVTVGADALFDVHIKRFHEYKRQLLNLLEAIALWNEMRDRPSAGWTPRVKLFGGKAAPGYVVAKQIIHLINDVAAVINADPVTRDMLQIVFPENYNVSMAELLIPAADLSEQVSTAGKEASGTGNMKLALNGAPTIGTLDGANVEIRDRVGAENFFLFGLDATEAEARRREPDYGRRAIEASPRLKRVLGQIAGGLFSPGEEHRYATLVGRLYDDDYFLVTCDFDDYFARQRGVDEAFRDHAAWARTAALNTARIGWFSSDRSILGYARDIWNVEPQDRA